MLLQVGFTKAGKILALDLVLYSNGGNSLDLSKSIMDRALLHADSCYNIPNLRVVGHVCKTNIASNTAYRGFGGPQVCFPAIMFACRGVEQVVLSAACYEINSYDKLLCNFVSILV